MELDDLKTIWNKSDVSGDNAPSQRSIQLMVDSLAKSRRSIRSSLIIEIAVAAAIYCSFIVVVFLFGQAVQSFLYKLVIITLVFVPPIYYRLFKSIRFLGDIDYGRDLKSNLVEFLIYYKTTLQFYRWGSYFMILLMLIFFFTDASFLQLSLWLQVLIVSYLLLAVIFSGPLIRRFYGREINSIESFLKE